MRNQPFAYIQSEMEELPPDPLIFDYLAVGGGGGGADGRFSQQRTGGGGAGGMKTGTLTMQKGNTINIGIGAGVSRGDPQNQRPAGKATDSFIQGPGLSAEVTALGGGNGGGGSSEPYAPGSGGSGGGAAMDINYGDKWYGGAGTEGQGNNGGSGGGAGSSSTAGGGGAAQPGASAYFASTGCKGGDGAQWLDGNYYAGGGAGAGGFPTGAGGLGGGGYLGSPDGLPNTGGGGCGKEGYSGAPRGGSGGSGIVKIRYPGRRAWATGGTITFDSGYVYHTFTGTGQFTF